MKKFSANAVRSGSATLVGDRPRAPLGPLTDVLPLFEEGATLAFVIAALIGVAMTGAAWAALRVPAAVD